MHATKFNLCHGARVIAGLALALSAVGLYAAAPSKQADAFPTFDSYIKISGKVPSVTGNPAAYAERFRSPDSGAYGIEALHFTKDVDKNTTMEVDGKALVGAEDYLAKMKLTKNEVGTFEMGYKSFRTFYDGIGGYFPLNKAWMPLGTQELHTDRAKFWVDGTIALPNMPVFRISYMDEKRTGRKDTTIWGDTDQTGIPIYNVGSLNPISANRKIDAAYIDLDEHQKTLEATVKHTVGNTDLEFAIVNNKTDSNDTRSVARYRNELKPFPLYPTGQPAFLVGAQQANNQILGFDQQMSNSTVWTYTGTFETKMSDQMTAFGGISYQDAGADIAGNRMMTLYINTTPGLVTAIGGFVGAGGRPPYSYKTVSGRTTETVLTGNLGFTYKPQTDFHVTLALKGENLDMNGRNMVNYISNGIVQSTGVVTPVIVAAPNESKRTEKSWVPELDVRYTGIKDLALYGNLDFRVSPGDEYGNSTGVSTGGGAGAPVISYDNTKFNHAHYKVGANWTVNAMLSLRGEIFYKDHQSKFTGYSSSLGDSYVLGYEFQGYKLTGVIKPTSTLTFTSRYVGQKGKMNTTVDAGTEYQSMDSTSHMFGETLDWNPSNQAYVQANLNVVFATISTAYPRAGGTANDVLRNADNDYMNGNIVAGFVVNKTMDAQLEYTFYKADNYNPLVPSASMAFGAGVKEYTLTAGLKVKLSDQMIGRVKVGYFDSKNDTTGGNTNFKGPMAYVSLDYAL
ncbi:MAG: hypothetical protein WCR49_06155 [Opitutae bacterium]